MRVGFQGRTSVLLVTLALLGTGCGGEEQAGPPRIRQEAYQNVFSRVFEQNPEERWWSVITEVRSPCETCTVTVRTSLRADSATDLIDAAGLCNAVIAEIEKSGVNTMVTVEGILRRGRTVADGSVRLSEEREYRLASGENSKLSGVAPDRCLINGIMANTHAELQSRGWRDDNELVGSRYSTDERGELRRTQNFYESSFSSGTRQLDDGTWAYFRR